MIPRIAAYLAVSFFMFFFSFFSTISFLLKTQRLVACPDVRRLSVEQAEVVLKRSGLELQISRYEKRKDVAKGLIIQQRPEPNVPLKLGRKVYVTVSSGPELIIVPDLKGLKLDVAEGVLSERKLKISKKIFVPSENEGKILAHEPEENREVLEGEGITLFVGKRPKTFFVMPDVSNWELKDLLDELDLKGVPYRVTYVRSETQRSSSKVSVGKRPGTIFRSEEELEVTVLLGG